MIIPSLILITMGGIGLALSFYIPNKEHFSSDHAAGAGFAGAAWAVGCFIFAAILFFNTIPKS